MTQAPFLSASWYRVASLTPRLPSHVLIRRHVNRGVVWHVLLDQATGKSHRISTAGYAVVGAMDGTRTVEALWLEAARQLGDEAPSQDDLIALLAQLDAADLLQIDKVPDALAHLRRKERLDRRKLWQGVLNPLSVRLPLVNPDRMLCRSLPAVRWLFSGIGALAWVLVVLPAIVLAAQHWPELSGGLSDQLLGADNLILMGLSYVAIKMLHELGHGYAVRAFGGAVPEMGVMLLAFLPMPYVDASASSGFPSKWKRIAVSAAGIAVETFLAALAVYVWVLVEPGLVRAMAFNVIVVAGLSTVLVNGNPLLRYDGYYVLADLIEIPNLAQRANGHWGYLFNRHLFGVKDTKPVARAPGERAWFLFYAPASFVYRLMVTVGIALFVASQYLMAGIMLALLSLVMGLVLPSAKSLGYVLVGARLHRHRGRAVAATLGLLAVAAIVLFWLPVPLRTTTEGVVWLPDSAIVRAGTDGFVHRLVAEPGRYVRTGEALVESDEPALSMELRRLRARVEELQARHASEQFADRPRAEVTRIELRHARTELGEMEARVDRLVAKSASDGTFAVSLPQDLPGSFVREGQAIAFVLPEGSRTIRAVVDQDDIDLVRQHLRGVEAILSERRADVVPVRLIREVPAGGDELPSMALSSQGGGLVPVDPREPRGTKTLRRVFQVDLELPQDISPALSFGSRVHVRFDHDPEPVGVQLWRRLRQLLLSRLNI